MVEPSKLTTPMVCTAENANEFRAALRAQEDIHAFAKALFERGMIDGLKGAVIAPAGALPTSGGVRPVLPYDTERRLADAEWAREQAHRS